MYDPRHNIDGLGKLTVFPPACRLPGLQLIAVVLICNGSGLPGLSRPQVRDLTQYLLSL